MSRKIVNLQQGLGGLPPRKPKVKTLENVVISPQTVEYQNFTDNLELQLISQIPGNQPFLIPDLIPDVIFLLQYEGAKVFLDTNPIDPNVNIQILVNLSWNDFLTAVLPHTQMQRQELINTIYNLGVQPLSVLFSQADPENPSSLIFNHSSQEVHVASQKIEIEIIRNEPEVTDHATEQCVCGSKRIKTTLVQTRSGDEASTVFAECVKCHKKWKFSAA
jgi:DNA-directed RNA polymerase subunit M/transcription elongation factor TFIIS